MIEILQRGLLEVCGFLTQYTAQILAAALLYACFYPRRKLFWLRFLPTAAVYLSPLLGRILSAVADRRRVVHLQFPALICALLAAHLVLLCHDVAAGALLFHRGVCHAELHG